MALVDILIGVVIGFVGGVVVPAAVLYRYRHRIGQRLVERQARRTFEEGFDLEDAFDGADMGEPGVDHPETGPMAHDDPESGPRATGRPEASGEVNAVAEVLDGTDGATTGDAGVGASSGETATADTPDTTVDGPGSDTGRCDCGELVSPELDEECPNCGAPVVAE
jgi:hypothetical protein